ncbi:TetR/AcrR family transcriptional regulator [Roseibium porphyridii]|uniref:TetR/AcrR family transcriptional regulator n=1 Tax=Roseibium porphyridii TaxID=2866279 RepID=A0ABY8FEB0_9HYPH|nr:TetR/AcrR family transcriptional regulator [Roseibium sp. KMA01]WFE90948.1 TetR/AcrR family transcriptional regulator [Roseibium sp. KMA01]
MPRMTEAEKRKSHKRILDAAAYLFREQGTETTSVADVMKAAGLTHGGFYRHFSSKDELVAAAFKNAVDNVLAEMESASSKAQLQATRDSYIETYLSQCHVKNRGEGCPLAALAGDLSRGASDARHEGFNAVERVAALLKEGEDQSEGIAMLALMLGTVTLARLADTDASADAILDAGSKGVDIFRSSWPAN